MIPYGDFFFFYIMGLVLIPAILLGLFERKLKVYGFIASMIMALVIFNLTGIQIKYLVLYYLIQLLLIKSYSVIRKKNGSRPILWIFLLVSLLPLVVTKLSGYFLRGPIGFLGISYLTFKVIQMLLEIYDGLIKEVSIFEFTYFLLFFPTISSGPIDRSRRFIKDINNTLSRAEYLEFLGNGLERIVKGILYKFLIAFLIQHYWLRNIPTSHHTFLNTINYMYAYSMYLFFDFAGYSLMAIGTSYILGVKTPDNFNLPFISQDMKDFWNRWHMSLSFWFRDFVYTRFVMSSMKNKWFKSKYTASYIGYLITMGLMGLWHGTELHYIVYGLYQALLIILTDLFQRQKSYRNLKKKGSYKIIATFVTFNLICLGFLIFSGFLFK